MRIHPLTNLIPSYFFFSSRRRHTRSLRDWSSDVCSSDLGVKSFALSGNRIGVLYPDGSLVVKEGALDANWGERQADGVQSFALSGNRIGVLYPDGSLVVKEGALDANWGERQADGVQMFA